MFLGNSLEKWFLERASTTRSSSREKRSGGRELVNSLSEIIKPLSSILRNHDVDP